MTTCRRAFRTPLGVLRPELGGDRRLRRISWLRPSSSSGAVATRWWARPWSPVGRTPITDQWVRSVPHWVPGTSTREQESFSDRLQGGAGCWFGAPLGAGFVGARRRGALGDVASLFERFDQQAVYPPSFSRMAASNWSRTSGRVLPGLRRALRPARPRLGGREALRPGRADADVFPATAGAAHGCAGRLHSGAGEAGPRPGSWMRDPGQAPSGCAHRPRAIQDFSPVGALQRRLDVDEGARAGAAAARSPSARGAGQRRADHQSRTNRTHAGHFPPPPGRPLPNRPSAVLHGTPDGRRLRTR